MTVETFKRLKSAAVFILGETTVAMVVVTIATLGALCFQYYVDGHACKAEAQITAAHTARLLLEDSEAQWGLINYGPKAALCCAPVVHTQSVWSRLGAALCIM